MKAAKLHSFENAIPLGKIAVNYHSLEKLLKVKKTGNINSKIVLHLCDRLGDYNLHTMIKEDFAMEDFGIKNNQTKPRSREDAKALQIIEGNIHRVNGRFETGLLWQNKNMEVPNSRINAENRLRLSCTTLFVA